jgi:sec-independent protein translocase protein TatA
MTLTFAGIRGFGVWEVILIASVILILMNGKKLEDFRKGLGEGIKEFRKATREVNEELAEAFAVERPREREQLTHHFGMGLIWILGIVCLILVWCEICK